MYNLPIGQDYDVLYGMSYVSIVLYVVYLWSGFAMRGLSIECAIVVLYQKVQVVQ